MIGDFTEKLAEEFFSKHCVPTLSEVLVPTYEWQKIWEVCGGRPKLLLACVERAAETLNWSDGKQIYGAYLLLLTDLQGDFHCSACNLCDKIIFHHMQMVYVRAHRNYTVLHIACM